jgi:hypothetical protein
MSHKKEGMDMDRWGRVTGKMITLGIWMLGMMIYMPSNACADDVLDLTRQALQSSKREIIRTGMKLSEKENSAFWIIYSSYEAERALVTDRAIKLIAAYSESFNDLSDENAKALLKEYLSMKDADLKIKKAYVEKFGEVLPPKKVFRFFQIENKLEAILNIQLATEMPLVW